VDADQGRARQDRAMNLLSFTRGRSRTARRRYDPPQPGSRGEHMLQERYGTRERATKFYNGQVTTQLTPKMMEFIGRMEMAFVATSDAEGECDCSFRAGPPGFLRVLDNRTIAYPEFRGNGVMASLGNILENPHIGIFMADFTHDLIGLHVNGDAQIVTPAHMEQPETARTLSSRAIAEVCRSIQRHARAGALALRLAEVSYHAWFHARCCRIFRSRRRTASGRESRQSRRAPRRWLPDDGAHALY